MKLLGLRGKHVNSIEEKAVVDSRYNDGFLVPHYQR